jgi:hypothetical protein
MTPGLPGFPIAERWNGKRWKKMPSVAIPRSGGQLEGVSCTSARDCLAVGFDAVGLTPTSRWRAIKLVVQRLSGNRWKLQRIPQASVRVLGPARVRADLSAISCSRGENCLAVGAGLAKQGVNGGARQTFGLAEIAKG